MRPPHLSGQTRPVREGTRLAPGTSIRSVYMKCVTERCQPVTLRGRSLITGRRPQNDRGGGGKSSFTPTKKGKGGEGFSHAEGVCVWGGGGGTQSFGIVLNWELEVLAILKGGGTLKVSTL